MESAKYKLARESAGYGVDQSALVHLSDLMVAIELVMTTAAGLAKEHVSKWLKLLRLSVSAICGALGDEITPENLLIENLINSRAELREKLLKAHASGEATHHINHLRLLFAFARGMGLKHKLFDVEQEWEQLPFFGKDRAAQMVITFLIERMILPKNVTQLHFKDFQAERREHYSIPATNQAIAYLKMRIREAGLEANFPLLDVDPEREFECCLTLRDMDPSLKTEVEAVMAWLSEEVTPGITRMSEYSRKDFLMLLEILCGFADWLPHVGTIASLSDCLNRPTITAHARWLYCTARANQVSIKTRIYTFHAFLTKYPPFANQDWSWMGSQYFPGQQSDPAPGLIAEFPVEPESEIEARRRDRTFDYNYGAIDHLPEMMAERRESESSHSEVEIGWMLHDEFLMGWLGYYPLPPRCMYECRIHGDRPNLFRASEHPDLVPECLRRTKISYLLSDDMWVLLFAAEEVPNRNPWEGPLPDQLVPGLVRFLKYRPKLVQGKDDPGTLFLNRDGGALNAVTLGKLVGNISERYLGKRIAPSAFKDIAAYRHLDRRPKDYSTLASLQNKSVHGVRMRYDRKYRLEHRHKPKRS